MREFTQRNKLGASPLIQQVAGRVGIFKAQRNIQCGVELLQTGGAERSDVVCKGYFGEADQFVAVDAGLLFQTLRNTDSYLRAEAVMP